MSLSNIVHSLSTLCAAGLWGCSDGKHDLLDLVAFLKNVLNRYGIASWIQDDASEMHPQSYVVKRTVRFHHLTC